jgi:hypothetical protein
MALPLLMPSATPLLKFAATSSLRRARNSGRLGKGGKLMLKRATQRTAGILAMRAASAAAITGNGADPIIVDQVCDKMKSIFQVHGAVHMKSPLLRPRPGTMAEGSTGGVAEVINARGAVLLLPEDLVVSFGTSASSYFFK